MRKKIAGGIAAIIIAGALSVSTMQAQDAARPKGYQAVTKPSMDVILSFVHPGRVAEMLVDVGDEVKANQLLAREDDTEEQAALAIDESKAKDDTTVTAQQKIAAEKAMSAKRMQESGTGVGVLELEDALLQADVEQAKVKLSVVQHLQDELKFKQSSIAVEKMKLYSPINGIVAQRLLEVGESADGGDMKALRIVQLDPLRIEVPVPILESRKLKEGGSADVAFADKVRTGKIVRIFPVGDAASETLLVRVEIPNPDKLSSGEKVFVNFAPAAAGVAKP
jgi:RND family efflux transporter MFP subunit